ncbi:MAG: PD-(D/E)XK nuclease family transposase [Microcoleaceae cyanobacterium]
MRFINPKTDYAFKKIFSSAQSKHILISFLNALFSEGQNTICDLEFIDTYEAGLVAILKDSYLDVRAKLDNGSTVIYESIRKIRSDNVRFQKYIRSIDFVRANEGGGVK